jgi:hypothetical protein
MPTIISSHDSPRRRFIARTTLTIVALAAMPATQTPSPFAELDDRQLPALPATTHVVSGDFDRDGDPDLFVMAERHLEPRLLLNDGNGGFVIASGRVPPLLADWTNSVAADVDRDGDLDLLLGRRDLFSPARLYVNDGAGHFTDATDRIPVLLSSTAHIAVGDVDGDGDPDLLAAGTAQDSLFLNDGTGRFSVTTGRLPFTTSGQVHLVDLDRDGDLDVVRIGATASILANDGTGHFVAAGNLPVTGRAVVQDVDRDGLPDLWVLASSLQLLINQGNLGFANQTSQRLPATLGSYALHLAYDADGDSDGDLIFGRPLGFVYFLQQLVNDGSGRFTLREPGGRGVPLDALDVDRDRDVDVVTSDQGVLALWINNGSGDLASTHTPRLPPLPGSVGVRAFADVDGDGHLDVFVGGGAGTPAATDQILRNDRHGRFAAHHAFDVGPAQAVAFGDIDRDGDLDMVVGCNGPNFYLANDGSGRFTDVSGARMPWNGEDTRAVALGDVDGDGRLDLLLGNYGSQNRLYLGFGAGQFYDYTQRLPQRRDATKSFAVGDVDGDRDLDLVVGSEVLRNDAGAFLTTIALPVPNAADSVVALGDHDADGDLDLVHALAFGFFRVEIRILRNDGGLAFAATQLLTADGEPTQLATADLDEDGDRDALLRTEGPGAGLYLLRNGGVAGWTITLLPDAPEPFALGDLDLDGDVDLLTSGALLNTARQLHMPARTAIGTTLRAQLFDQRGGLAVPALSLGGLEPRLPLGNLGLLGLDPATLIVLPALSIPPQSSVWLELPLPPDPSLRGATVFLQALELGTPHLTGTERRRID